MALELWRERASQESFSACIIREIQDLKQKMKLRIQSLHVEGSHHEANKTEETVAYLVRVEESMKRMLREA